MDIFESDFVLLGRRKIRIDCIVSIASYPETAAGGRERVIIDLMNDTPIIVPSSEPHFPQALALYHAIDAADVLEPAPSSR